MNHKNLNVQVLAQSEEKYHSPPSARKKKKVLKESSRLMGICKTVKQKQENRPETPVNETKLNQKTPLNHYDSLALE